jgi:hypothetical protein
LHLQSEEQGQPPFKEAVAWCNRGGWSEDYHGEFYGNGPTYTEALKVLKIQIKRHVARIERVMAKVRSNFEAVFPEKTGRFVDKDSVRRSLADASGKTKMEPVALWDK